MVARLKALLAHLRVKLAGLIHKRHQAKPGGKRRGELAGDVQRVKKHKAEVAKSLEDAKSRSHNHVPDFNGCPTNVVPAIVDVIKAANSHGLYVTATTNGTHAPTSWHYSGHAVDVAAPMNTSGIVLMKKFQAYAAKRWPSALEIFGPDTYYIKNGVRYAGAFPDHGDHVHVAL